MSEILFEWGFLSALVAAEIAWLNLLWEGVKYAF